MPSHDAVCMYHHLLGQSATRAFGHVGVGVRTMLQGSSPEYCEWSVTRGLRCKHRTRPSMQVMRCSRWLVMLTDTGHQVSLQPGTGSDAFLAGVAFSSLVIICRNDVTAQYTVVDHEFMHARRCICIRAETIEYGSRNVLVCHRGTRRTMNSPRKVEIRTPQY